MLKDSTTAKVPIHFPNKNPPTKETGDPNPKNGNTHNIANSKNTIKVKMILESLNRLK